VFDVTTQVHSFAAGNRRFLLEHGDLINRRDRAYLFWRTVSKSRIARAWAQVLPARLARRIVHGTEARLAETNFTYRKELPTAALTVAAHSRFRSGVDVVLWGHFHRPWALYEGDRELTSWGGGWTPTRLSGSVATAHSPPGPERVCQIVDTVSYSWYQRATGRKGSEAGMGGTLLLADDSITIQKVVELTFAETDHRVIAVSSGHELFRRLPEVSPHVILCDVVMPDMNGYEVCQKIKSEPATLHLPVILLTGTFEPFDRDRALAVGCDAIVTKPFEAKELITVVEDLLRRTESLAAIPAEPEAGSLEVGVPDGVPALDFTTTGFDKMVAAPPPAHPVAPEEGIEITSIGLADSVTSAPPPAPPELQEPAVRSGGRQRRRADRAQPHPRRRGGARVGAGVSRDRGEPVGRASARPRRAGAAADLEPAARTFVRSPLQVRDGADAEPRRSVEAPPAPAPVVEPPSALEFEFGGEPAPVAPPVETPIVSEVHEEIGLAPEPQAPAPPTVPTSPAPELPAEPILSADQPWSPGEATGCGRIPGRGGRRVASAARARSAVRLRAGNPRRRRSPKHPRLRHGPTGSGRTRAPGRTSVVLIRRASGPRQRKPLRRSRHRLSLRMLPRSRSPPRPNRTGCTAHLPRLPRQSRPRQSSRTTRRWSGWRSEMAPAQVTDELVSAVAARVMGRSRCTTSDARSQPERRGWSTGSPAASSSLNAATFERIAWRSWAGPRPRCLIRRAHHRLAGERRAEN